MNASQLMQKYSGSDIYTQLKAGFLLRLYYLFFALFPVFILYSAFIQLNLADNQRRFLAILIPEIVGFLLLGAVFTLLVKGYFIISAHLTIILISTTIWSIIVMGGSTVLTRLDTIVFIPAILSMTPLIISRRKSIILLYTGGNLFVFFLFILITRNQLNLPGNILLEYIADSTLAVMIAGLIAYQIFAITEKALEQSSQALQKIEAAEKDASNARLFMETSFANSPMGIILAESDLVVNYVNAAALSWNDLTPERVKGKPMTKVFSSYIDPESLISLKQGIREHFKTGNPVFKSRLSATGRNNQPVELSILLSSNHDAEGNDLGVVIFISDITEHIRLEEMMIQTEKMASVGGLAAGMAHEINNPLAAITQHSHLLRSRLLEESKKNMQAAGECGIAVEVIQSYMEKRRISKSIDAIIQSVQRASQILSNMLSFTGRDVQPKSHQDLGQLAEMTIELARKSYDLEKGYDFRSIRIERDFEPSMPRILCEASEIQQAILNILTNGSQAMLESPPDGKKARFTIRTRREPETVRLEIEDNGPGIDAETRKRIFEPFFSTNNQGAGLGLAISYFIIKENHQGSISVESSPGMGAKFVIRLPIADANPV